MTDLSSPRSTPTPKPLSAPKSRILAGLKAHQNKLIFGAAFIGWAYLTQMILAARGPVSFRFDPSPLLQASLAVQIHTFAALAAFFIGAALLIGVKGRGIHKRLGYTWVVAMAATAVSSFFLYGGILEHHSWIHGLSAWTIIGLPMGVAAARARKIQLHAKRMTGMFVGAMAIAGLFTFLPGRTMWHIFFQI